MYIPKEMMKVNRFEDVAIPSNKSFFARLGAVAPETLKYSGDDVVPEQLSKSDSFDDFQAYAEMKAKEEMQKEDNK